MTYSENELAMIQIMNRVRSLHFFNAYPDLSPDEAHLLHALCLQETCSAVPVSTLTSECHRHPAAVSRLLRSLDAAGLIERRVDPADRRSVLVTPTEKGRSVDAAVAEALHNYWNRVLSAIPREEMDHFVATFHRLLNQIDAVSAEMEEQP